MKNPQTIWASVTVIFILVASATALIILDKDVSVILTLAMVVGVPVLGAFGVAVYHKLEQVKEASNGSQIRQVELTQRVMEMQQKTQEQLTMIAMSMTPPTPRKEEKPADDLAQTVLLRPPGGMDGLGLHQGPEDPATRL